MKRKNVRRWCAYVLRCADGTFYAGATNDIAARLARHNAGKASRYTRSRLPVAVVLVERFRTKSAALRREAAIKKLTRKEKLSLISLSSSPL